MIYVYTCENHNHLRIEKVHSIREDPEYLCPKCGEQGVSSPMHRVPQVPMQIAHSAYDTLMEWSHENYKRYRARKRGHRVPRFSPDHFNRPYGGLPKFQNGARRQVRKKRSKLDG